MTQGEKHMISCKEAATCCSTAPLLDPRCDVYLNIQCASQYKCCRKLQRLTHTSRVIQPQPRRSWPLLFFLVISCIHKKIEIAMFIFLNLFPTACVCMSSHTQQRQSKSFKFNFSLRSKGGFLWSPLLTSGETALQHRGDLEAGGYCPLRKARWPLVHLLA